MAEKDLEQKVEKLQEANINLRFNTVEKELLEIKSLLKESIQTAKKNHELALQNIEDTRNKVSILEEKQRNCPISAYKGELKRFGIETKFIRYLFKKTWVGVAITTIWIIIVILLLAAFGLEPILKLLTLFK